MAERILSEETVFDFHEYLVLEEKSTATVEKYLRDVRAFHLFLDGQPVTKEQMIISIMLYRSPACVPSQQFRTLFWAHKSTPS